MPARKERELLTSDEKVLLHLLNFLDIMGEDRAPFAITQQGISDATGLQRSHIPRIASRLEEKGYISTSTRYVQGSSRRRKTYTLTQKGAVAARAIFTSLMDEEVIVVTEGGEERLRISDIPSVLGDNLSFFTILKNIRNGRFVVETKGLVDFSDLAYKPHHFFGREKELQELREGLQGDVRLFLIQGIAGIGKSSLVSTAILDIKQDNNIFWHEITEWDDVNTILLLLSQFFSEGGANMLSSYLKREKTPSLAEVSLIIRDSLKKIGPTVMIFDDLQNATGNVRNLLRLISMLIGETEHLRLVFLSRETFAAYINLLNVDKDAVREMKLSGLGSVAAGRILKERNIKREFWPEIIQKSGGHPLALELVFPSSETPSGENVEEFIRKELMSNLDSGEREMLFRIAIFRNGAMPSALHLDIREMEHINNLMARGLLTVIDGRYRTHQLIRTFILSKMGGDMKKRLHSAAASFFLSQPVPDSPKIVEAIYHQIMAEDYYHAAHIIARFGPRLINDGFSGQLLEFMEKLPESDEPTISPHIKRRFVDMKARIYSLKGQYDDALALYAREIEFSGSAPSPMTFYHMADILYLQGDTDASLQNLNRGLEYISHSDTSTLSRFELLFGKVFLRSGMYEDALRYLNRCLRGFVSEGDMNSMMEAFQYIATIHSERGDYPRAEEFFRLSLNIATELQNTYMIARSYHNIGAVYHDSGRLHMAEEYFQRAFEIWRKMGAVRESAWATFNISEVYIEEGMVGGAAVLLDQAEETLSFIGDKRGLSSVWKYRGKMYAVQGNKEEAVKSFEKARSLLSDLKMPQTEALVEGEYGISLLMLGDSRGDELISGAVEEMMRLGMGAQAERLKERAEDLRKSD